MKFIIPQNYDFSSKLFGIIDYSTAIFDIVWCLIIFCIVNCFSFTLIFKIFVVIILSFPVLLLQMMKIYGLIQKGKSYETRTK